MDKSPANILISSGQTCTLHTGLFNMFNTRTSIIHSSKYVIIGEGLQHLVLGHCEGSCQKKIDSTSNCKEKVKVLLFQNLREAIKKGRLKKNVDQPWTLSVEKM